MWPPRAINIIADVVESGTISQARIEESVKRNEALKISFPARVSSPAPPMRSLHPDCDPVCAQAVEAVSRHRAPE
jgi:hypothetical protein